ncbi:DNA polymerase IV [Christensenellaceae bacterium OttesenSCG-928-M15]|nr:DNA polymerase IV [Christensenellaceae bacterium OttesenSCG-928-M15]
MERTILHCDCNSFYASVEQLHHPELRGKPVVVGGDVEARHGIVLTKSQEAKPYGIQVGMALWQARERCPNVVIVPPNYKLYLRYSREIRRLFSTYTDQIEPFGLDEAWLDVSGSLHLFGDGAQIAEAIRQRVKDELGITVSIGVSWNKIFAKLGSDYKKPDAVTVISKRNFHDVVWPLPAEDLLSVGRATRRRLYKYGVYTIGDIAKTDPTLLKGWFGKWGTVLSIFAQGYDSSPVKTMGEEAVVKGIGNSTTTPRDLYDENDVKVVYYNLAESVAARLREQGLQGRTVAVSLRDNELFSFTRQMKLQKPTCLSSEICAAAMKLVQANYKFDKPLRSIGVRVTDLSSIHDNIQLTMFEDEDLRERQMRLEQAVDDLRRRFGHYVIGRAVYSLDPKLRQFNAKGDHVIHPVGFFNGPIG